MHNNHAPSFRSLIEIIITANKAPGLPDLLDFFLTTTLRLPDYDAGAIYPVDRDPDTALIVHEKNLQKEFLAQIRTVTRDQKPCDPPFIRGEPIFSR